MLPETKLGNIYLVSALKIEEQSLHIDCTEVHVQSPGNFEAQSNQYSSYISHTTYKFLVAISPNGDILFVSDAFEGSIGDKEIVRLSGFLDFLNPDIS